MTNLNPNQFAQVPIRGQLDLQIQASGGISGQISADETAILQAGDAVKLDSTNTGNIPKFLLAGDDDDAVGQISYDTKQAVYVAGNAVQVAFFGGPVMFVVAAAAITPGAKVEQVGDAVGAKFQTISSHKQRGIALDPAAADGSIFRMIITNPQGNLA